MQYTPVGFPFFVAFWFLFGLLVDLIQIGILEYVFESMGGRPALHVLAVGGLPAGFELPLSPESDSLIALCDQWWMGPAGRNGLDQSRYLCIPVSFGPSTGEAQMVCRRQWDPFVRAP